MKIDNWWGYLKPSVHYLPVFLNWAGQNVCIYCKEKSFNHFENWGNLKIICQCFSEKHEVCFNLSMILKCIVFVIVHIWLESCSVSYWWCLRFLLNVMNMIWNLLWTDTSRKPWRKQNISKLKTKIAQISNSDLLVALCLGLFSWNL